MPTFIDEVQRDIDSLAPQVPVSRRGFIVSSLATGFAAAVAPVSAQTISTDSNGLTAGEIKVKTQDGEMPAYRAQPAGKSGLATILVVQEIFGVHEHIKDVCRRLAKQGYLAIAPELYARQGDPSKVQEIAKIQSEIVAKVPDAQVMADLDACVAWAEANGGNAAKLGITGFCWGGRITWLYAAHQAKLKAGVAWYGRLVGQSSPNTPQHPVDIAGSLKAPVLGLYGGKDGGIPLETVEQMKGVLKKGPTAAQRSEFHVYPDAPHAFNADYRPSYNKAAAEDGWKRMLAWFKEHGLA
jgi:carboxymethylenebutenolidase